MRSKIPDDTYSLLLNNTNIHYLATIPGPNPNCTAEESWYITSSFVYFLCGVFSYGYQDTKAAEFFTLMDYVTIKKALDEKWVFIVNFMNKDYRSLPVEAQKEICDFFGAYDEDICDLKNPMDLARFVVRIAHYYEEKQDNEIDDTLTHICNTIAIAEIKEEKSVFSIQEFLGQYIENTK